MEEQKKQSEKREKADVLGDRLMLQSQTESARLILVVWKIGIL